MTLDAGVVRRRADDCSDSTIVGSPVERECADGVSSLPPCLWPTRAHEGRNGIHIQHVHPVAAKRL